MPTSLGDAFITIRPETSQFSPELQAALTAAVEGAERSVEDIDINAELAAASFGKLEAQTAAAVQGVESSVEEIDVGAGLAPTALPKLEAQTAAAVQSVESSIEEISVGAGLSPAAVGLLKAETAAAVQTVESTTETISVKVGLNPASVGVLKAETEAAALSASGSFGKIAAATGPAALGVAAVAGAAVLAVAHFTNLAERVRDFSAVTGASLDQSSRLIEVFGDLGFNADAAERAFFLLNKNIATGSANLEKFGVETVKAADGSTDYIETLLSIAEAYQTAGSDAEKTGILFAAFGKSGASLAPILNQNADALRTMFDSVSDTKLIDAQDIADAQELRLAVDALKDSAEDLALSLGRTLLPALVEVIDFINLTLNPIDSFRDALKLATGNVDEAAQELDLARFAAAEFGITVGELTTPLSRAAIEGRALGESFELSAQAADEFKSALDRALGVTLNSREANRNFEQALDDLSDSLKKNGNTMDISTQAGRDNQAAFDKVKTSAMAATDEILRGTSVTEGDNKEKQILIDKLKLAKERFPELTDKINLYIKKIKEMPSQTDTEGIGQDIVEGIGTGMNRGASSLYGTISNIIATVIATARAAAQATSPSKKMAELGDDIVEGLLLGLTSSASRVESVFGNVIESNIDRLESRLDKLKERGSDLHVGAIRDQLDAFAAEGGKLKDVLDAAVEQVAERMGGLVNAVASGVGEGADIVSQFGRDETVTGDSLVAGLKKNLADSQSFAKSLTELAAGGLNTETLTQLAGQGPSAASTALIAAIQSAGIENINALQAEINKVAASAAEGIGAIVLPREKVEAGVAEAEKNFNDFLAGFKGFLERLDAKLDREAEALAQEEKRREARSKADERGLTGDARTTFIINEVAGNPRATAAAVAQRLGTEATR